MLTISLWLNVVVLIPVCVALVTNRVAAGRAFGDRTPARSILLSIYLSILVVSVAALVIGDARLAAPLLLLQVVYKLTTPFTVGTMNLITLWSMGGPLQP